MRVAWVKFIAGVLAVGGGSSLGREGPSVQLAGTLSSNLSALVRHGEERAASRDRGGRRGRLGGDLQHAACGHRVRAGGNPGRPEQPAAGQRGGGLGGGRVCRACDPGQSSGVRSADGEFLDVDGPCCSCPVVAILATIVGRLFPARRAGPAPADAAFGTEPDPALGAAGLRCVLHVGDRGYGLSLLRTAGRFQPRLRRPDRQPERSGAGRGSVAAARWKTGGDDSSPTARADAAAFSRPAFSSAP